MLSVVLFSIFTALSALSPEKSFYLGPNFPNSPCSTKKSCIEVKVTKSSTWTDGEIEGEIYEGDTIEVTCYSSEKVLSTPIFFVQHGNKTTLLSFNTTDDHGITAIRNISPATRAVNNGEYHCRFENNVNWMRQEFAILMVQKPVLRYVHHEHQILHNKSSHSHIECEIDGYPTPIIKWFKNGAELNTRSLNNRQTFPIKNVNSHDEGVYNCTAINRAGFASQSIQVKVVENTGYSALKIGSLSNYSVIIVIILCFIMVLIFARLMVLCK